MSGSHLNKHYMRAKRFSRSYLLPYQLPSTSTATTNLHYEEVENVATINPNNESSTSPISSENEDDSFFPVSELNNAHLNTQDIFCTDVTEPLNHYPHPDNNSNLCLNNNSNHSPDYQPISIASKLAEWALKHNITHTAINELLSITKEVIPELPTDARSFLGTCRNVELKSIHPGKYHHFGIRTCINNLYVQSSHYSEETTTLELIINIDGLPLSKSSSSQVYPILCRLSEDKIVDMIGIYHGYEKPKEANCFLQEFVDDAVDVITNGIIINCKEYKVTIKSFICDAPAKSFITYTKGHTGYFSCTKCHIEGSYSDNRVCFPETKNLRLRTDSGFRLKLQADHHNGTSVIERIPNFDMVDGFPLDYMHLICLGVVKKLLMSLWCCGKPSTKIAFRNVTNISDSLINFAKCMPLEFNRKPRSLIEVKRWKATEFRQFLFYTGPVALRNQLNKDRYLNFITLHVASTILSNRKYNDSIDYAHSLLQYFVETFKILYGQENMSHNIHNLMHLSNDVRHHGALDDFSAFPFENFLQTILKSIRKSDKPLSQIIRRRSEKTQLAYKNKINNVSKKYPIFSSTHSEGPTLNINIMNQFKKVNFQNFVLQTAVPDNCCSLKNGNIIEIKNIVLYQNQYKIIGNKFLNLRDLYEQPCKSSELGIFVANLDLEPMEIFNVSDIDHKCVKLEFETSYIIFPLIHTY